MRPIPRLLLVLTAMLALCLPAARPAGAQSADLQTSKADSPDPVPAGGTITYDIVVTNNGPNTATGVTLDDTLPAGTTFLSLSTDTGWSCTTPAVGAGGTVSCSFPSLALSDSAAMTLTVAVDSGLTPGTTIDNTADASAEEGDPNEGNNSGSATTTVATPPPGADLSVTKVDDPDPVSPGENLVYTITVTNAGPDAASANFFDTLPPETTFVSLSAPGGWTCSTPAVGDTGDVSCGIAAFGVGSAVFTLTVAVGTGVTPGSEIFNVVSVSTSSEDPNEGNNNGGATTSVAGADLSVSKTDSPDPVTAGANLVYTITVANAGPDDATDVDLLDTLPAGTTFVSLSPPGGWSCTTPAAGSGGDVSCSIALLPVGSAVFTLTVAVDSGVAPGTVISNSAGVSSSSDDPDTGNDSGSASTTVAAPASPATVSGTKSVSGTFTPGGAVTYTVVLTNSGPNSHGDNPGDELTDVLPAGLTLVSAFANSGTATANLPLDTVTWNGSLAAGASVTITINAIVDAAVAPGTTIANQGAIAYDADGNGTNEASAVTDDPATPAAGDPTSFQVAQQQEPLAIPTLDGLGLALLAALLALGAAIALRKSSG